ncbi:hypothetical protein J4G37_42230, partial [Microvirga sp. 3-52]|nr:hypothetical protein [Microvirga sp. 3-52]
VMDVLATYKEIDTIEFVDVGENEMTGGTHYAFELNGVKGFSYYFIENEMYGDESIVIEEIKEREVKLTDRKELLALKDKVKVLYGGWEVIEKQRDSEVISDQIEAERMSVVALKNTFADIRSVEFKKTGYNEKTGSYRLFVAMTNQKNETVNFSFSFSQESPSETGGYIVEDEKIQVEGITTNKVQVIYSNKEEEEI